jgi:glycerophosphoryl diester phosphodiesterase
MSTDAQAGAAMADWPYPLWIAHRGAGRLAPENTLAGFRRAAALGVPAIELDARLTRDRRAVVVHDDELDRLTGTPGRVSELTWDELSRRRIRRELPMGIDVHGDPVVVRYARAEPIPLLAEVLAELPARVAINIELKLDLPRWWPVEVGEVVARVIADAGAQHRVIVTSFDPRKLRAAGRARPGLALGFCFDDGMLDFARALLDRLPPLGGDLEVHDRRPGGNARGVLRRILGADLFGRVLATRVLGAEHTLLGGETVSRLHRRGIAVGTHTLFPIGSTTGKRIAATAATAAEVHRLAALGVDWLETDDPERVMALIS